MYFVKPHIEILLNNNKWNPWYDYCCMDTSADEYAENNI